MNTPSAEALALAVKLSGHTGCECAMGYAHAERVNPSEVVCPGCLGDAGTIEKELKLKERDGLKAAAFTVVTEWDRREMETPMRFAEAISALRDALKAI